MCWCAAQLPVAAFLAKPAWRREAAEALVLEQFVEHAAEALRTQGTSVEITAVEVGNAVLEARAASRALALPDGGTQR